MLSAVIVSYDSQSTIAECVAAAVDSGIERILIWENSRTSSVADRISEFAPEVVFLAGDGENVGFGGGVNRAMAALDPDPSDEILLLNPDCVISRETLQSMRTVLAQSGVGIVAPRMTYADGKKGIAGGGRPSMLKELLAMTRIDDLLPTRVRTWTISLVTHRIGAPNYADSLRPGKPISVDWISGFCMLVKSETLSRVGGFDESYFLYFEDVDLCERVRKLGLSVVVDRESSALHYESTSTRERGKPRLYRAGMWTYFSAHGTRLERALARRVLASR